MEAGLRRQPRTAGLVAPPAQQQVSLLIYADVDLLVLHARQLHADFVSLVGLIDVRVWLPSPNVAKFDVAPLAHLVHHLADFPRQLAQFITGSKALDRHLP